ncbi:MAG TPA: flagellar biosynthesis anti-sigma factor FlgM [Armatimonadota bacterium]|nr:flagellar biosynthesis anti-sigma factor FlgM [Armatimonadota bacterium]
MKITNEHVGRLLEARLERTHRADKARPGGEAERPDRAVFSARSEEVRVGMAAARGGGQSDEGRLARLASQVRAGEYRVSAQVVAEALLRDLVR